MLIDYLSGAVTQIFCQGIRNMMGVYGHYPGVLLMAEAAEFERCLASQVRECPVSR